MQRRELLKLIAAAPLAGAAGQLIAAPSAEGAKLLVVFLRGAYDCTSLLVPTAGDFYYASRPNIAIARPGQPNGALPLDSNWGLHPALAQSVMPLFQQKQASFIAFAAPTTSRAATSKRRTPSSSARRSTSGATTARVFSTDWLACSAAAR